MSAQNSFVTIGLKQTDFVRQILQNYFEFLTKVFVLDTNNCFQFTINKVKSCCYLGLIIDDELK